jgi:signal transduction histidine kinase
MKLRLQSRIALYFMIATGITVSTLLFVMYLVLNHTIYQHLDNDLMQEAKDFNRVVKFREGEIVFLDSPEWYEREHLHVEVNPLFYQIVDTTGIILSKSPNLADRTLIFSGNSSMHFYFNAELETAPIRQLQLPLHAENGTVFGYIILALPLKDSLIILEDIVTVFVIGLPVTLLLLFLITRLIAGTIVRPISHVIFTAEKITRNHLDSRVPLPRHEDELSNLATTINELLDRLQDALLREKQFTADASHELRTPVAAIKGTLDVLIRRPREIAHYEERIRYCITELDRLNNLIDRLLSLARYENGKSKPVIQQLDLSEQVRHSIDRFSGLCKEKKIAIGIDASASAPVAADPSMLEIMLDNIFNNAIKFSSESGTIEVQFEQSGSHINCIIRDNGPGIPADATDAVFERFIQSEPQPADLRGSGLGLSITKKLAVLQNISVSLESHPHHGTAVTLQIPRYF